MGQVTAPEEAQQVQAIKLFGKTIVTPQQQHYQLITPISIKKEEVVHQEEQTITDYNNNYNNNSTATARTTNESSSTTSTTTTTSSGEMKRPDKIVPCPRCKSMETKFCYFNNYNVNQPRHFCKGCQRYWTAGGALRNVPIGAGRRKAKPMGREGTGTGSGSGSVLVSADGNCVFDLDRVVLEEWAHHHYHHQQHQHQHQQIMVVRGGGGVYGGDDHDFPAKRRRNESTTTGPIINC